MADNDQLLKAIESIKKDMATKQDIQRVEKGQKNLEQGQTRTNTSLGQITTVLKTLEAGQEATKAELKADIHDLKVDLVKKVKSHEIRIENLEEHTGTPNPHKN